MAYMDRFFEYPRGNDLKEQASEIDKIKSLLNEIDCRRPVDTGFEAHASLACWNPPLQLDHLSNEYSRTEDTRDCLSPLPSILEQYPQGNLSTRSSSGDNANPESSGQRLNSLHDPYKEKNRAAQKKFRDRQKARMAQSNRRLQELEGRLQNAHREKEALESRLHLLNHTMLVNSTHYTELECQQEAYQVQQGLILMDTARIYRKGLKRPDLTLEDTKQFTMKSFLRIFEHFIARYKILLESGASEHGSPEHLELSELVASRRMEEARIALFSKWSSATLAWNREETRSGVQLLSLQFYQQLLPKLRLTPAQQKEWLRARSQLLKQLEEIRKKRETLTLGLGLLMLQNRQAAKAGRSLDLVQDSGQSPEEQQLRLSLEDEREAVLTFLHTVIDLNMNEVQEAQLDVSCYPWWPCLWTLCNILACKHGKEPADTLVADELQAKVFPCFSAAELLKEPLLARMAGLQLKRTVLSVPTPKDVISAAGQPAPQIANMQAMKIFEVMCGKHLEGLIV